MTENRRRFFYNGFILTLVALAMRTISLFFGAYVTRTVGEVGMGLYTLINTVYGFAITLATSGVSLTVTRLVASAVGNSKEGEVGRVLGGAFLYSAIFGVGATVGLFVLSDFLSVRVLSEPDTAVSMKILSASLLPVSLTSAIAGYFVGVKRVGFNAAVQVSSQLLKIPITVWLISEFKTHGDASSVAALCLAITATEIISFIIIFAEFIYDTVRHKMGKFSSPNLKSVAESAVPLGASAYVRSALLTVEHSIIPKRLRERGDSAAESFAAYGALHGMALPMILYPMAAISSFAGLLVPEFAESMAGGGRARMDRIGSEAANTTLVFASVSAVFLYVFSEELGYVVYNSYNAGYYIAMLAPVVPIMYLDHVTDAMLKGIGEQVFSMWVNISDSFISIILVWTLIPKLGVLGYALAIIGMEAYNFVLSALRLRKHVSFSVKPIKSLVLPTLLALASAEAARCVFSMNGAVTTPLWLILKMSFAACLFVAGYMLVRIADRCKKRVKSQVDY